MIRHMCHIVLSGNEESLLIKCKFTELKKPKNLSTGYKTGTYETEHHPNKVMFNFWSHIFFDSKKIYFVKGW